MSFPDDNLSLQELSLRKEINFWLGILIDHARFMRNGFDPTEEQLFETSNEFSRRFVNLNQQSELQQDIAGEFIFVLQDAVMEFIAFKGRVAQGIEACRILSILPAGLIDHIRCEAIFFSGVLARIKGEPRPIREEIGVPGTGMASTAPQLFIPRLPGEFRNIAYEEMLFWLRIASEHMGVLSEFFRPEQVSYRRETLRWERRIGRLYEEVLDAFQEGRDPGHFITRSLALIHEHAEFLRHLFNDLVTCSIPGKQANFWPRLADHMLREDIYFIEVLIILQRMQEALS